MSVSERPHEYALLRWIDLESTKIDERLISILTDFELGNLHNKKANIIKTNLTNLWTMIHTVLMLIGI